MNTSEYSTLYVLRNVNTGQLVLKSRYDKYKTVYARRKNADDMAAKMSKYTGCNIIVEEIH